MATDSFDKNEAIREVERLVYKDQALKIVTDKVIEASNNPDKVYQVSGQWIVQFHNLVREYADELKDFIIGGVK